MLHKNGGDTVERIVYYDVMSVCEQTHKH